MTLQDLVMPLDRILKREGIAYAIIGAYAVAAWGEVRATRDIDLLCDEADLDRLKAALAKAKLVHEHRTGDAQDPVKDVVRIQISLDGTLYEIDVLFGIRSAPPRIVDRSRVVELEGLSLKVASPEDLIILKLLAGSARDFEDALSIMRIQKHRIDRTLLQDLCPDSIAVALRRLMDLAAGSS